MKIVDVKTYPVVYPVKDPFSNGMRTTRQRPFGIVEVITDSGLSGWGEGTGVPARRALESQVIGRSPFDYEVIWEGLQLAGEKLASEHAGAFRDLVATFLIDAAPLVKKNKNRFNVSDTIG